MADEDVSGKKGKGFGHHLSKAFNFAAKTAIIGAGLWGFGVMAEYTFLHSGLTEGNVVAGLAREFFTPIFEATGVVGWGESFDPEPIRSALKSVHEFFGIADSFAPKVLDVAASSVEPW